MKDNKLEYKSFSQMLERFFSVHLLVDRGLSKHTISSYCTTFTLLLNYLQESKGISPTDVEFRHIDREVILQFLRWLETTKGNCARSLNQRLSAIRSFYQFMTFHDVSHIEEWKQIIAIAQKKYEQKVIKYLTIDEIKLLLEKIPTDTISGRRDLTLLSLLYNTGMRVSELIGLKVSSIRSNNMNIIEVKGKGNKRRLLPLESSMGNLLQQYIVENKLDQVGKDMHPLFYNVKGEPLSDEGINYILNKYVSLARNCSSSFLGEKITPHVLRHSRAVHWLNAGIDIVYLRDLMGHTSVQTTEIYAKVDSKAKKEAIQNAWNAIGITEPNLASWEDKPKLIEFLESFKRK